MSEHIDALKSLHTALIDSRNGYEEAIADAEGRGLSTFFREMMARRTQDAVALEKHLSALGERPNNDGSFMSTIHRTVISVRALFGDLDERILPGLVDGEERILSYYDEAIRMAPSGSAESGELKSQRAQLEGIVADMRRRAAA